MSKSDLEFIFPMPEFRPGQLEILMKAITAFENGHKFFVAEAPVGIGKSPVGFALLQYFGSGYYITTQKILQDQLVRDFGPNGKWVGGLLPLVELKGRNAYECLFYKHFPTSPEELKNRRGYLSCGNDSPCVEDGRPKFDECADFCLYHLQREKALKAPLTLFNFYSFAYHVQTVRRVLIVDEAHRIEGTLMDMIRLTLSSEFFAEKFPAYELPRKKTVAEYQAALRGSLLPLVEMKIKAIREQRPINADALDEFEDHHRKIVRFLEADPNQWVLEIKDKNETITEDIESLITSVQGGQPEYKHKTFTVVLAPVTVADYAEKYLFQFADHVLLMSGTILDKASFLRGIGVKFNQENPDEQFISVPNIFPVENRRIVKRYAATTAFNRHDDCVGDARKRSKSKWPLLTKMIDTIAAEHINERGILHAHSFNMAEFIYANVSPKTRERILYQGKKYDKYRAVFDEGTDFKGDREALLAKHSQSQNTIILAPAMNEGLDLHDELGRFQMICKMPWPGLTLQLERREILHPGYMAWLTAIAFSQALGRIVRHPNDWGITYVLDYGFESFLQYHRKFLPMAVLEALKYEENKNK